MRSKYLIEKIWQNCSWIRQTKVQLKIFQISCRNCIPIMTVKCAFKFGYYILMLSNHFLYLVFFLTFFTLIFDIFSFYMRGCSDFRNLDITLYLTFNVICVFYYIIIIVFYYNQKIPPLNYVFKY